MRETANRWLKPTGYTAAVLKCPVATLAESVGSDGIAHALRERGYGQMREFQTGDGMVQGCTFRLSKIRRIACWALITGGSPGITAVSNGVCPNSNDKISTP